MIDRPYCIFVAALLLFFGWLGYWLGNVIWMGI